jgi:hypothetical protein
MWSLKVELANFCAPECAFMFWWQRDVQRLLVSWSFCTRLHSIEHKMWHFSRQCWRIWGELESLFLSVILLVQIWWVRLWAVRGIEKRGIWAIQPSYNAAVVFYLILFWRFGEDGVLVVWQLNSIEFNSVMCVGSDCVPGCEWNQVQSGKELDWFETEVLLLWFLRQPSAANCQCLAAALQRGKHWVIIRDARTEQSVFTSSESLPKFKDFLRCKLAIDKKCDYKVDETWLQLSYEIKLLSALKVQRYTSKPDRSSSGISSPTVVAFAGVFGYALKYLQSKPERTTDVSAKKNRKIEFASGDCLICYGWVFAFAACLCVPGRWGIQAIHGWPGVTTQTRVAHKPRHKLIFPSRSIGWTLALW